VRPVALLALLLILASGCKKEDPAPAPSPAPQPTVLDGPQEGRRRLPALAIPPPKSGTLLGGELGLDHVAVAVRDLDAAKATYGKLGFAAPSPGKLPNGIQNINYYFVDTTYLETMTAWDAKKAGWLASFTKKHEGAYFLALCIRSAEDTTAFLRQRGFEMAPPIPGTIQVPGTGNAPRELWKTLFFKKSPFPEGSLFFIAYGQQVRQALFDRLKNRRVRRMYFTHPNTALGVRAVWMAVKNAAVADRAFQAIGLPPGREVQSKVLGARGRLVPAGIGDILVLEPSDPKGKVAAFLADRGEGLLGISIQVRRVAAARVVVEQGLGRPFIPSSTFYGEGLLLPPELTHGTWLELSE
jgi:hypothetical protein